MEWISVDEELPKPNIPTNTYYRFTNVLIYDGSLVYEAIYWNTGEWEISDGQDITEIVTHWMPLPEPPS